MCIRDRSNSESKTSFWGGSTTDSENRVEKQVVSPGELMAMPKTHPSTGMQGYYIVPRVGEYGHKVDGQWVSRNLIKNDARVRAFEERPEEHQYLEKWDQRDYRRIRFPWLNQDTDRNSFQVNDNISKEVSLETRQQTFRNNHKLG